MKNVVLTSKNDKPLKVIEKTNAIHEHTRIKTKILSIGSAPLQSPDIQVQSEKRSYIC
jgi:hypothetical protein